jgi:thiamine-monophosphate kinase
MAESELLQHIYGANASLSKRIIIPPGDDMGAVRIANTDVLVTVDQVVDGVHVNLVNTSLEAVGRKAVVRNLSDVAAMAALPVGAVAAALLPRDFGEQRANELFDHMRRVAEQYDCPLFGGDIAMHDGPLVLTVTVLAESAGIGPIRRSGAVASDGIYVTGELGGAWDKQGGGPHLTAKPRIKEARSLAGNGSMQLHSMIDLSDGLASDLRHICEQSDVDSEIEATAVPCRPGVDVLHALTDGEDYELCFTAAGDVPHAVDGVAIHRIGTVLERAGTQAEVTLIEVDNSRQSLPAGGWEHGRDE